MSLKKKKKKYRKNFIKYIFNQKKINQKISIFLKYSKSINNLEKKIKREIINLNSFDEYEIYDKKIFNLLIKNKNKKFSLNFEILKKKLREKKLGIRDLDINFDIIIFKIKELNRQLNQYQYNNNSSYQQKIIKNEFELNRMKEIENLLKSTNFNNQFNLKFLKAKKRNNFNDYEQKKVYFRPVKMFFKKK